MGFNWSRMISNMIANEIVKIVVNPPPKNGGAVNNNSDSKNIANYVTQKSIRNIRRSH